MKGLAIFSVVALAIILALAVALIGFSVTGFGGSTLMVVTVLVLIVAWGIYTYFAVRGLLYALTLFKEDSTKRFTSIKWTSKLLFTCALLSLVTGLAGGFFAFASCGPAFLAPFYFWSGFSGAMFGFLMWFVFRHVVHGSMGGQGGDYAERHHWAKPTLTHAGIVMVWALIWIIGAVVLSGSVKNPKQYHAKNAPSYHLPYPAGKSAWVVQGNNSRKNHSGKERYAYDFRLSCGTPVLASRAGEVITVTDTNSKSWGRGSNNKISVKHSDGTVAHYFHIKQNSAVVKEQDTVSRGDKLAAVGTVGNSLTGHIHFELTQGDTRNTIPVSFADVDRHEGIPRGFKSYKSGNR